VDIINPQHWNDGIRSHVPIFNSLDHEMGPTQTVMEKDCWTPSSFYRSNGSIVDRTIHRQIYISHGECLATRQVPASRSHGAIINGVIILFGPTTYEWSRDARLWTICILDIYLLQQVSLFDQRQFKWFQLFWMNFNWKAWEAIKFMGTHNGPLFWEDSLISVNPRLRISGAMVPL